MSRMTYSAAVFWALCFALGTVTATALFYGGFSVIALGLFCLVFTVYIQAIGAPE